MNSENVASLNTIVDKLTNRQSLFSDANFLKDIGNILNTKSRKLDLTNYPEVNNSILNYGLPNFSEYSLSTNEICQLITDDIKKTLLQHEPRLESIEVESNSIKNGAINFVILATLRNEPAPIEITFDSSYTPTLQQFKVNKHQE